MKKDEFKEWLQIRFSDKKTTVSNRISNCKNVEKYYGDLGTHFIKNKCSSIMGELKYTIEDERARKPQRHKVPINGKIRTGSATLKQAVKLYVEFREHQAELAATQMSPDKSNLD